MLNLLKGNLIMGVKTSTELLNTVTDLKTRLQNAQTLLAGKKAQCQVYKQQFETLKAEVKALGVDDINSLKSVIDAKVADIQAQTAVIEQKVTEAEQLLASVENG